MTMPPLPADTDLDLEPDADGELDAPARSGIQSIEVGFRLLEVLTHTTGPMAHEACMQLWMHAFLPLNASAMEGLS